MFYSPLAQSVAGFGFAVPFSERQQFPGVPDNGPHATDIDYSISQPLLRNAGRRASTCGLRIAALDTQIAQARTKLEGISQIACWRRYASVVVLL